MNIEAGNQEVRLADSAKLQRDIKTCKTTRGFALKLRISSTLHSVKGRDYEAYHRMTVEARQMLRLTASSTEQSDVIAKTLAEKDEYKW